MYPLTSPSPASRRSRRLSRIATALLGLGLLFTATGTAHAQYRPAHRPNPYQQMLLRHQLMLQRLRQAAQQAHPAPTIYQQMEFRRQLMRWRLAVAAEQSRQAAEVARANGRPYRGDNITLYNQLMNLIDGSPTATRRAGPGVRERVEPYRDRVYPDRIYLDRLYPGSPLRMPYRADREFTDRLLRELDR